MKEKEKETKSELPEEVVETETDTVEETISEDDIEIVEDAELEVEEKDLLAEAEAEAKDNFNKWQRSLAEFDNFRKRTIKEKSQMYENGAREVVEKLLPVLDNFERALSHVSEDEKESSIAKGVEMIYKQMLNTFADLGIEEIKAEGETFDPNLHHAVSHEENEEYGENQVIDVLQKGFIYKERVIRHSMVRVAN